MVILLHQAIDRAAERHPDQEALRCYGAGLTYQDLAIKTNSLARFLRRDGLEARGRVGVYLNKSLEAGIAVFGIMKAGGAYVPLDPGSPTARTEFVIRDCGIRYLITDAATARTLPRLAELGVHLDGVIGARFPESLPFRTITWDEVFATPGQSPPDVSTIEQDLAYVMYTSGSTGDPKGIMHTHHSGLSYAKSVAAVYELRSSDRIANHSPLHFDISTYDFFGGALVDATVVIIPEEYTKLPASFSQLLQDERVSVIFTVPFALIQLLLRGALDQRNLSAMRWVLYGGEPFPPKHLHALMEALPQSGFSNIYGPAEVNGVTYFHVPPLADNLDEPIPIGQMLPFAQGLVVDSHDEIVAPGEMGEFLIRSPTMMQGYWGRPDLNARAFFRRQVFPGYEEVYYRTGDLVRLREDGNYLFFGRKDRQIKTRGYRVELDEVEAALDDHPDVEESAVFPVADGQGSQKILSAVILRPGAGTGPDDLLRFISSRLPPYALPVAIELMDSFPRTSSGKISRRTLQAWASGDEGVAHADQ